VARSRECQGLAGRMGKPSRGGDFSRDGRLLATAGDDGVRIWDAAAAKELTLLPLTECRAAIFCPDANRLVTCSRLGLYHWPMQRSEEGGELEIGPPERIDAGVTTPVQCTLSADGHTLAVIESSPPRTVMIDLERMRPSVVLDGVTAFISADGRWAVSSTWPVSDVKLWDARTGQLLRVLPQQKTCGHFSPDGKWLVTGRPDKYQFWQTESWEPGRAIPWEGVGDLPGKLAFARDTTLMAVQFSRNELELIDSLAGDELARLQVPYAWQFTWITLSPDGSHLAAQCADLTFLWDLRLIRHHLATMGLDWTSSAGPVGAASAGKQPLRVRVNLGELAGSSPGPERIFTELQRPLDAASPKGRK
jgi:WD40 repeat protein